MKGKLLEQRNELLEACKGLIEGMELHEVANKGTDRVKSYIVSRSAIQTVKQAIAKAEGRE